MLDDQTIKRLLLRTAAHDTQAFQTLYELTAPLLLGVATRLVRRREMAEDILHDAYVKIWQSAHAFDPLSPKPVAWLVAIVRNRALDVLGSADVARQQSFDADADPDAMLELLLEAEPSAEQRAQDKQVRHSVNDCLRNLKDGERQAVALAYLQGLSHHELAEQLQRPLGTVKAWVRRGLDHLRDCVQACLEPQ